LLSRFKDDELRKSSNDFWKKTIIQFKEVDKDEDQRFIQAWLRAKYAETIRQSKAGASNEDFEKIGTRFHNWVRDNLSKIGINKQSQSDFDDFINRDFKYFSSAYMRIHDAERTLIAGLESVYYINQWGIATSLSYPLMLAPIKATDTVEMANAKMNLVAKYIDIFCVRRSVNFRTYSASSIRYTMYNLVKEIRDVSIEELTVIFQTKLNEMSEVWDNMSVFKLHGQNGRFIKYLLSRLSGYVDVLAGENTDFMTYHVAKGKPFEIEHIWANKFEEHKDEFEQLNDFNEYRNRLGALVLLPRGTNQSYNDKPFQVKKDHYIKENLLVKSLHPLAYQNNPNFNKLISEHGLPFTAHEQFNKQEIEQRQALYQAICEKIWTL
jgi:hypothetical protein